MRAVVTSLVAAVVAGVVAVGVGVTARAEYATGGVGLHKGLIDWFEWGADGTAVTSGVTRTNTRTIAGQDLRTTCRITDMNGAVRTYRPGGWRGDALDELYNIGGTGAANQLVSGLANTDQGTTVSFRFACSVTLAGAPVPLAGLVVADAEASNTNEYVEATPDQPATWRVIDRDRQGCTTSTVARRSAGNTLRFSPDGSECANSGGRGPMAVGFMEGATSARVALKGGGRSAIALGVVLGSDFGDAPASYGQAGSLLSAPWTGGEVPVGDTPVSSGFTLGSPGLPVLRLGATVDSEGGPLYSDSATGDDTTGADDEDSVTPPDIHVTPGQEYTLPGIACTGTGVAAGWVDWNHDGVFGEGERSGTAPCAGGAVTLTWPVPADARDTRDAGRTFLRLRVAATAEGVAAPTGLATTGETEDHAVTVTLPRLRLAKTSDATADTRPGDVVRYTVTATNAETTDFTDAYPAAVVDDLTGVLDDGTYGEDATADRSGDLGYRAPRLTWTGPLAAGDSVTISYTVRIGARTGDGTVHNVVCDPAGTPCAEHRYPLPSLSVTKSVSRPDLPAVGEQVTFTITVRNEGPGAYTDTAPARLTDDLTRILDDADVDPASITASAGAATYDEPRLTWTGALAAGASATIAYTATYTGGGDLDLVNTACVPEQETAPTFAPCATVTVPAARLTRWKEATPSADPVVAGSTIAYTLHFRNDGRADAAVAVVDDLTHVLDDADVTTEPVAGDGLTVTRDGSRIAITGTVPVGATRTVTYTVTVRPDGSRGDDTVANFLLDPDASPPPTPECAPAEDERPDCTTTPVAAVTVTKAVSASTEPLDEGTVLTYTVTVRSTGTAPAPVAVDDDLSGVLDDTTFGTGPTSDTGSVTATGPEQDVIRIRGTLPGGATATVTYTVTVNGADRRGDNLADNFLVPPGEEPPDECAAGDPSCTTTPLPNVAVAKSVAPESGTAVAAGEVVTYTVSFTNTGTGPGAVDRTDHLAGVLDDADLTGGPDTSDPAVTATRDDTTIRMTGTLAAGATVHVTYSVTVRADGERGDHLLTNAVVRTGDDPPDECAPDSTTCTENPVPYLRDDKSVDPASGTPVVAGQELTYTLTFTNDGRAPAAVNRADDLTQVLDDATLVRGPTTTGTVTATLTGARLAVTGTLAPGTSATVTYGVRVLPAGQRGDDVLANVLFDPDDPNPDCDTGHCTRNPVGDLGVAKSADPPSGTVVAVGDQVTYTLTFHNTGQGHTRVDHTDHLTDVLDDADLTSGPTASLGLLVIGPTDGLLRVTGSVAPAATATVTYTVTVRHHGRLTNHLTTVDTNPPDTCLPTNPLCTEHPVVPPAPALPDTGTSAVAMTTTGLGLLFVGVWLLIATRGRSGRGTRAAGARPWWS